MNNKKPVLSGRRAERVNFMKEIENVYKPQSLPHINELLLTGETYICDKEIESDVLKYCKNKGYETMVTKIGIGVNVKWI